MEALDPRDDLPDLLHAFLVLGAIVRKFNMRELEVLRAFRLRREGELVKHRSLAGAPHDFRKEGVKAGSSSRVAFFVEDFNGMPPPGAAVIGGGLEEEEEAVEVVELAFPDGGAGDAPSVDGLETEGHFGGGGGGSFDHLGFIEADAPPSQGSKGGGCDTVLFAIAKGAGGVGGGEGGREKAGVGVAEVFGEDVEGCQHNIILFPQDIGVEQPPFLPLITTARLRHPSISHDP